IDGRTGQVTERLAFDTYAENGKIFLEYVQHVGVDDIIALASFDDAFYSLGRGGKSALRALGATMADALNYRANIVLVGRRNRWHAFAEQVAQAAHKGDWGWAARVNV